MHHNPILIEQLNHAYADGTQALCGIDLSIHAGETVALVGANGSGKSTLLLHLNGILPPQKGRVVIGEWSVEPRNLRAIRDFVGLVFQNPDDQLFMPSVWDDVAFGPMNQGLRGKALEHRVAHALADVGLQLERYASRNANNLSGGEKKRVAIAGVLAMQPQVLVFDEPSAQLDPCSRRRLIQLLAALPQTKLIATHDLDLALELCGRTVVLCEGRVAYDGPTEQVLSDAGFLTEHALEPPLCYSRPYCQLEHAPLSCVG